MLAAQTRAEAEWLLQKMRDYNFGGSILEIGSHAGGFLACMAYNCKPGSKIRSIDVTAVHGLDRTIQQLKDAGFDAEAFYGNSKSEDAFSWARKNGPYDFIFIDGDHTYMGVWTDWMNYGTMGRWIGFHDIKDKQWGTVQLWNELKDKYPSMEFSVKHDWNGIGLLQMPQPSEKYLYSDMPEIKFNA